MTRHHHEDRASWLTGRKPFLTASDISCTTDDNPWKTVDELYNEKMGFVNPKDISGKANVIFGTEAEQHIRSLFALEYVGIYKVEHYPFDIISHDTYPFLGASLDGELTFLGGTHKALSTTGFMGTLTTGDRGVYEVKTTTVRNKEGLEKWQGQIPTNYFAQHCLQLFVTGYQFGIVDARIVHWERELRDDEWQDAEFPTVYTSRYLYFFSDPIVRESMIYVVRGGIKTHKCIVENRRPGLVIKPYK